MKLHPQTRAYSIFEMDGKEFRIKKAAQNNKLLSMRYLDLDTPNESISLRRFESLLESGKIKIVSAPTDSGIDCENRSERR